jgi:hypothetical protein
MVVWRQSRRGEGGKQIWETDSVARVKDAAPRRRYIVIVQHERPSIALNPRRSLESLDSSPTLVTSVPENLLRFQDSVHTRTPTFTDELYWVLAHDLTSVHTKQHVACKRIAMVSGLSRSRKSYTSEQSKAR